MTNKNETLRENRDDIRERLIATAKKGGEAGIIFYGELVEKYGIALPDDHREVIDTLEQILCEISEEEHNANRPLLSAVVVLKDKMRPGKGFYTLAERLGKFKAGNDRDEFFSGELGEVHKRWGGQT